MYNEFSSVKSFRMCTLSGGPCAVQNYTLISDLKMTLYKRESSGFLLVLIEMRQYFLQTI